MNESLVISAYADQHPIEEKDGFVTLWAECWRDANVKEAINLKIYMTLDDYLECLHEINKEENLENEYFIVSYTNDCWESCKKVFGDPNSTFAMMFTQDFELIREDEDEIITIIEF